MAYEEILYAEDGAVGTITLNRPDDGNMFTPRMCHEIRDCINDIRRETRTRVIVLTGAGERFFCIGGRKEGMEDSTVYAGVLPTLEIYESIDRLQKPVIASVNGVAAGGGCNLALACDMRIASDRARFGETFVRRGIHPDWGGIWFLPRLVGYAKAAELIFSGEVIDAQEALRIGLADRLVPAGQAVHQAQELARQIAANSPVAVRAAKRAIRQGAGIGLAAALDVEDAAWRTAALSADRREGIAAFNAKRAPAWPGQAGGGGA
jgi:naphthoate synthase